VAFLNSHNSLVKI